MKKNTLFLAMFAMLMLVGLVVIGNVIIIGDKIAVVHPFLSWFYYVLIAILLLWLIVLPFVRTLSAPELKGNIAADVEQMTPSQFNEYLGKLKLTAEEQKSMKRAESRKETLLQILLDRQNEAKNTVKSAAVDLFFITAVSQNGAFDILSALVVNFRMINKIVAHMGFRPTVYQMFKIYFSVVSASLMVMAVDDILEDVTAETMIGFVGGGVIKTLFTSAANGAANSLVCMRVGYTTIRYLEIGEKNFVSDKSAVRKHVRGQIRANVKGVAKDIALHCGKRASEALNLNL